MAKFTVQGAEIRIGAATDGVTAPASDTFTKIGNVQSATVDFGERDESESTDWDSGGAREFLSGLRDSGSMQLELRANAADAGQALLDADNALATAPVRNFKIVLPNAEAETYDVKGFVRSLSPVLGEAGEVVGKTCTIRHSGQYTRSVT